MYKTSNLCGLLLFQIALFTCDDCLKENEYSWAVAPEDLTFIDSFLNLDLSGTDSMFEIAAPTCSYRMGVVNMGYVVVILGKYVCIAFVAVLIAGKLHQL